LEEAQLGQWLLAMWRLENLSGWRGNCKKGCEQFVHFVVKHKSDAETIGQKPISKEALL